MEPDASYDQVRQAGGYEVLNLTLIDVGEPGQVRLRLAGALNLGLHHPDELT